MSLISGILCLYCITIQVIFVLFINVQCYEHLFEMVLCKNCSIIIMIIIIIIFTLQQIFAICDKSTL